MFLALKIFNWFPAVDISCVMTDTESSRDGSRDDADMSPKRRRTNISEKIVRLCSKL